MGVTWYGIYPYSSLDLSLRRQYRSMVVSAAQLDESNRRAHNESSKRALNLPLPLHILRLLTGRTARPLEIFRAIISLQRTPGSYGENTHILLEDRKSLERPAALEKIRAEQQAAVEAAAAAAQPPPIEDDDVIILDAAGQEPGAVLPKVTQIPLPSHFRTTFISLKPPAIFEQFLGQVKAKWASRPATAMIDGLTCAIGTDWIIRIGYIVQGTVHKGIMLEVEYLPLQVLPPTTDGKPPAILAEFVASIVPQSHSTFVFALSRFSEEQWSEILNSGDDTPVQGNKQPARTDSIYSHGFEHAAPRPSDWGCGFVQERRSAFLLLRMLLDERLLI
ncbi:hypothetical protein FRC10_000670 [Ceratobasidium sp. 414]|nr:hypothetical protein FRC10_000670 [Ceratobasidium sp. 414]